MSRQGQPTNSKDIYSLYPQCSNVFIQVRNICFTGSLRLGGGAIFKVGGQVHVKKLEKFCDLNWQLCRHKN